MDEFKNNNFKKYIKIPNGIGMGNTMKGFITLLSITENTKIQNNNEDIGNFSSILDSKHIYNDTCDNDYKPFFTWRFLILKSEESEQLDITNEVSYDRGLYGSDIDYMFSHKQIDGIFDRNLICDKVYNRIISTIDKICWEDTILTEIKRLSETIKNIDLSISIRTWNASHEKGVNRPYDIEEYKKIINTVLTTNEVSTIFISCDNDDEYYKYTNILSNYNIITYPKLSHISLLQHAVIKMLIASTSKLLICNRISTYSELVFWFGKCKQKVYTVY